MLSRPIRLEAGSDSGRCVRIRDRTSRFCPFFQADSALVGRNSPAFAELRGAALEKEANVMPVIFFILDAMKHLLRMNRAA